MVIDFFSVEPKNKPVKKLNVDEKVWGYLFSKSEEIYKGKKGISKRSVLRCSASIEEHVMPQ